MEGIKIDFENKAPKHRAIRKYNLNVLKAKIRNIEKSRDVIKSSTKIRLLLQSRLEELDVNASELIKDAAKHGLIIGKSGLSRYFSDSVKDGNTLTQYQILFLCCRYGVSISFSVKKEEYDESRCISQAKRMLQVL